MASAGLFSVLVFPNDGCLNTRLAKRCLIHEGGSFSEQAQACYQTLYGRPESKQVRLFDDYGSELTSLNANAGSSWDVLVVVSEGEDFVPIDYKNKFAQDVDHLGIIDEEELSNFVRSLTIAISLDEEEEDYTVELGPSPGPADSEQGGSSLDERQSGTSHRDGEDGQRLLAAVLRTHRREPAAIEEMVIGAVPRIHFEDGDIVEDKIWSTLETLVPPRLDDDVHARAEGRDAVGQHAIQTNSQLDEEESMEDSDMESVVAAMMGVNMDVIGRDSGGDFDPYDRTNGQLMENREVRRLAYRRKVDGRYRQNLRGSIDQLRDKMAPVLSVDSSHLTRPSLFEHAAVYIKHATTRTESLAATNKRLLQELQDARNTLLAEHRLLRQRMVGIFISEFYKDLQKKGRVFPQDPNRPFMSRLVFWNHVLEAVTGYAASEVLGKVPIEVLGFSKDIDAWPFKQIYINQKKDGSLYSVLTYVDFIRDPQDKSPTHFITWMTNFRPFNSASADKMAKGP